MATRFEEAIIIDQFLDRLNDLGGSAVGLDRRVDTFDRQPASLELRRIVQIALLHFFGEGQIGTSVALGRIPQDGPEALRREACGHAFFMRPSNTGNRWRCDLFRQRLENDRAAVRAEYG